MQPQTELLTRAFEQFNQHLQQFRQVLQESEPEYHIFTAQPDTEAPSLEQICTALTNIWYNGPGDGRRTENLYGLIGVRPALIPLINQLNLAKANFQQQISLYRARYGDPTELLGYLAGRRDSALNDPLQSAGLARLHLKQCYRQLPVLEQTPVKIRFSWYTSGRSLKRLSHQEVEKMLLKMDTAQTHIQIQLTALARLPQSESLVQLQQQVPVMRANMVWHQNEQIVRKARNCPLPIFFPLDANQTFPEYNTPPPTPPEARQRQLRSDLIIDPEPYLPSLRIHRYKKT